MLNLMPRTEGEEYSCSTLFHFLNYLLIGIFGVYIELNTYFSPNESWKLGRFLILVPLKYSIKVELPFFFPFHEQISTLSPKYKQIITFVLLLFVSFRSCRKSMKIYILSKENPKPVN